MTVIGIDLGTSNSAAAVLRGGRPVIIPSAEGLSIGGKAFPSYVALTAAGQMLIGEPARRQATANPEGTVTAFKRKMGKRETIVLRGRDYSPEQLSAFLLQKIKRDAEAFLGEPVHKAVVTVAAYFDDNHLRDRCCSGYDLDRANADGFCQRCGAVRHPARCGAAPETTGPACIWRGPARRHVLAHQDASA